MERVARDRTRLPGAAGYRSVREAPCTREQDSPPASLAAPLSPGKAPVATICDWGEGCKRPGSLSAQSVREERSISLVGWLVLGGLIELIVLVGVASWLFLF